ncbi:hypothetical protein [Streptomonospora sp. PA3]|nr:hypothetical protein [Streptomonospora sp. PA3]
MALFGGGRNQTATGLPGALDSNLDGTATQRHLATQIRGAHRFLN